MVYYNYEIDPFKKTFKASVCKMKRSLSHSLRAGGSTIAGNLGISKYLIKQRIQWCCKCYNRINIPILKPVCTDLCQ